MCISIITDISYVQAGASTSSENTSLNLPHQPSTFTHHFSKGTRRKKTASRYACGCGKVKDGDLCTRNSACGCVKRGLQCCDECKCSPNQCQNQGKTFFNNRDQNPTVRMRFLTDAGEQQTSNQGASSRSAPSTSNSQASVNR